MKAAVVYGKEDVKIEKVPIPGLAQGEVLIKVQVALTCGTDLKVFQRGYHARMIQPPALFGHELAGTIEEVGAGVREFRRGMRVVALNSAPCGTCFFCSKKQPNLCEDLLFNNGAYETVQITAVDDPINAVRAFTPKKRGADVVIEAVGRPQAWQWAVDMVRKGGTVNFFGGCASGTKVELDTQRLHYSQITLKATFHHTPEMVRKAFALITQNKIQSAEYVPGEPPLSHLKEVLRKMLDRSGEIKTAIIPGRH